MKFRILIFYLTGIIFTVTNCTETTVVDTKPPVANPNLPNSTFTSIQQKVFSPICDQPGCHGNTNNQADLYLMADSSYSNLVNVPSLLFPGMTRVIPDSSSKSLIIKILKGEVAPRMPLSGPPFLENAVIDSIAKWIDNGALEN